MDAIENCQLLLPDDIVSYENGSFYKLIRVFLDDIESEIPQLKPIKNVPLLLLILTVCHLLTSDVKIDQI